MIEEIYRYPAPWIYSHPPGTIHEVSPTVAGEEDPGAGMKKLTRFVKSSVASSPAAPAAPAAPSSPAGIVRSSTRAGVVPVMAAEAVLPGAPVVTVPMVILGAGPGTP